MKRYWTTLAISEMQIKTTRYHYTSIRMVEIKIVTTLSADKDIEKLFQMAIVGENAKRYNHSGKQFGNLL